MHIYISLMNDDYLGFKLSTREVKIFVWIYNLEKFVMLYSDLPWFLS